MLLFRDTDDDTSATQTLQSATSQQVQGGQAEGLAQVLSTFHAHTAQTGPTVPFNVQATTFGSCTQPPAKTPRTYAGQFLSHSAR